MESSISVSWGWEPHQLADSVSSLLQLDIQGDDGLTSILCNLFGGQMSDNIDGAICVDYLMILFLGSCRSWPVLARANYLTGFVVISPIDLKYWKTFAAQFHCLRQLIIDFLAARM